MDNAEIARALQQQGAFLVFANVLLQQLGLPVPAVPTLIAAGSLALGAPSLALMLAAAVLASVLADAVWYFAGRFFGYRVLNGLCRLSLNPASCVNQTESRFLRWGLWSLVVAKFIPGFATVAPPIAGALRMPLARFLFAAALGAGLWAGLALLAGALLRGQIEVLVALALRYGFNALLILGAALALWLAWKLWLRQRFERLAAMPHISPSDLRAMLVAGQPVRMVDLRGATLRAETGELQDFVVADYSAASLAAAVAQWPQDALVVTLCACPEDAGAVHAAKEIKALGYRNVRPLEGGFDAWRTHLEQDRP
ncbi:DedA family protein/thiosulfate sulfurtransferase GlpE [Niveibacterium umoris]|uniref:Membrane protein DedA with SNARE-associated domain/rhodanese-related sulfurtransferase n=1 Tax=Niveibacterium umoris TaxID=1193620 RepID=A0A840BPT1_9RHOO|nr:VTT domain-containing protein [Niveibacterium umoris]MBB4014684.1 membrane protein DedA with SNARE-associated domain/rhodanese-related sulfurtransferase [Niveibacterium umoris]